MKKQDRVGEPITHKKIHKARNNIKEIRGLYKLYLRARRYALRLEAAKHIRVYVTEDGKLSNNRESAKKFAEGFDDFEVKRKFWQEKLGVKLIIERV